MAERIETELLANDGIAHGFFTRRGGVSHGPYATLNAGRGSGDRPDHVAENRTRIQRALGVGRLALPYQVHRRTALVVDTAFDPHPPLRADALVTRARGFAVGVVTADCAPLLLADCEAGVVAAAHAGWRGALAGIVEATVAAMEGIGARRGRIRAVVGPTIGQPSYEVSDDLFDRFAATAPAFASFFAAGKRPGKHLFDLEGAVVHLLEHAGIGSVTALGLDTYADTHRFFSYRRATHAGAPDYGRQLSAIALRE